MLAQSVLCRGYGLHFRETVVRIPAAVRGHFPLRITPTGPMVHSASSSVGLGQVARGVRLTTSFQ